MTTKNLPQLLLEAEERFDEKFPEEEMEFEDESYADVVVASPLKLKSFLRETILTILSEAKRATEVGERKGWSQFESGHYEIGYEDCRRKFKSKWRKWRDNLK